MGFARQTGVALLRGPMMILPFRCWPMAMLMVFATAAPAAAFDCGKAQTKVEKIICADAKLKSADDMMSGAYAKLKDSLEAKTEKEALRISQLRWIKQREACDYDGATDVAECARGSTAKRMALLTAHPQTGPGDGTDLTPWFIQKEGKKGGWDIDLNLIRYAGPQSEGEYLFNREAQALAVPALLENSTLGTATLEVAKDRIYGKSVSLTPTYASKRFISALAEVYEDSGGAHGNSWSYSININLDEGRHLNYGDLFTRDVTGILAKLCSDQLITARKVRTEDNTVTLEEGGDIVILSHIKDLERWSFRADKATVLFDPYEIGSFAEGAFTCIFDMAKLKTLAIPGAPLP